MKKKLAEDYETVCLPNLTQEEGSLVNKILNKKEHRRKACMDYVRNINVQKKGENDGLEQN